MRKRAFLFVVLSALALTSCNILSSLTPTSRNKDSSNGKSQYRISSSKKDSEESSENNSESISSAISDAPHSHTFDLEHWAYDDTQHWRPATCEHTDLRRYISDHVFGGSFDYVAATCNHPGSYKIKCSVCGYVRVIEIEQLQHNWVEDPNLPMVQPTKSSDGYYCERCTICDEIRQTPISYGQTLETALTVDEALAIGMNLEIKAQTQVAYYIKGRVSEITSSISYDSTGTFWLASSDKVRGFQCYRIATSPGADISSFGVGAEVVVYGCINRYAEETIEVYTDSHIVSITYIPTEITSLSFDNESISMVAGMSKPLALSHMPLYGNSTISWLYSNPNVIGVDTIKNRIIAYQSGTCVLTAFIDKNNNGVLDGGEVNACQTVIVETPDYSFDSVNLLGYSEGGSINISSGQVINAIVDGINFELSGIVANSTFDGCMRLRSEGLIKASGFPTPISKIIIEPYENRAFNFALYTGSDLQNLSQQPAITYENGYYVFDAADVRAFAIYNNSTAVSYINAIYVVLAVENTGVPPTGSYAGSVLLNDGSYQLVNLAFIGNSAYMKIGTDVFYSSYAFDESNNKVSIHLNDAYGDFIATYRELDNSLIRGRVTGSVSAVLASNGSIMLNGPVWSNDCNGTTEELQSIFKRRRRGVSDSTWVIDTEHEDRLVSYDNGIDGSAVQIRPWRDGAIALNLLEDFVNPITCHAIGYWVYNPGENDVTLRMWMYRSFNHNNAYEIGQVSAKAGEWTYCYMGFQELSTYNIQIADFTYSGIALVFDNISLF